MKSETMHRMDAMRAAGLTPDLTLCVDTLAPGPNGGMQLIPNPRWIALYNDSISVHLAYDQSKYGQAANPDFNNMTSEEIYDHIKKPKAGPTITPPLMGKSAFTPDPEPIEGTFVDITPVPQRPKEPMSRQLLIKTARGFAKYQEPIDAYFAWLLNELADALEAAVDPDDCTNLED
jgi:hypothetical protein